MIVHRRSGGALIPISDRSVTRSLSQRRVRTLGVPRVWRLWAPLTPLALLLSPLVFLSLPFLQVVLARRGVSAWRTAVALGSLIAALSGTLVEIETPTVRLRLHIQ